MSGQSSKHAGLGFNLTDDPLSAEVASVQISSKNFDFHLATARTQEPERYSGKDSGSTSRRRIRSHPPLGGFPKEFEAGRRTRTTEFQPWRCFYCLGESAAARCETNSPLVKTAILFNLLFEESETAALQNGRLRCNGRSDPHRKSRIKVRGKSRKPHEV